MTTVPQAPTSANPIGGTPTQPAVDPKPTEPSTSSDHTTSSSSSTSSTTSTTSTPTEPSTTSSSTSSTSSTTDSQPTDSQPTHTTAPEPSPTQPPDDTVTSISTVPPPNEPARQTTVYFTSTTSPSPTLPKGNPSNGVSSTSTRSSATASATGGGSGSSGLSAGGTIAIAVVVPVVSVALIILAALYFWRKWKAKKAAEEERRKEVEEYGFNPNNDPTLPPVMGSDPKDDPSGYRGWGTTSTARKASTNLSNGAGVGLAMSEAGSAPGYHHAATPSDGTIQFSEGQMPETEPIGILGAAPAASNNRASDIRRGPSNASSAYSAANRSEASEESHMSATHPTGGYYDDNPYYSDMQAQYGAYGDGPYVPNQPVIRDVQARRNTRIENPAVFPRQGNAGVAQNF